MKREEKIRILKGIYEGTSSIYDLQDCIFIFQKDGKNYLSDGNTLNREITDEELSKIKTVKLFFPVEFLGL